MGLDRPPVMLDFVYDYCICLLKLWAKKSNTFGYNDLIPHPLKIIHLI